MAKTFFVTDFESGNYVKCPKSPQPVSIVLGCQRCECYHGGGIDRHHDKSIIGNCYVNCNHLQEDSNIQMEIKFDEALEVSPGNYDKLMAILGD